MPAPPLTVTAQPLIDGKAVFLLVAPSTASGKEQAKIVLRLRLRNDHASQALTLKAILFSFPGSSHAPFPMQGVKIAVSTPTDPDPNNGVIPVGTTVTWSNGVVDLDTTEAGENKISNVVYLNAPPPPKVKVDVSCNGYSDPVSLTLDLVPFTDPTGEGALILPFLPTDLEDGEYIVTSARHWANGGPNGTQIFAHDISVQSKASGEWSSLKLGKDKSKNEHYRIHGKPVRALADGTVISWKNDTPENPKPGEKLDIDPLEGNHFWVRHGGIKVKYAHLIPGSLPAELMVAGATVNAGQKLGLAGNSGNSDGPHLHLEAVDFDNGTLRALPFRDAWVLKRDLVPADAGGPWVPLKHHGIPFDTSAIWPASTAPRTVIAAAGIARAGDWGSSFWTSPDRAAFEAQAQSLFEQKGRRLIQVATYREGTKRRWVGVARDGDWSSSFWVSNDRASFEAKAQQLFDEKGQRLIHVSTFPEGAIRRWVGIARGGDWGSSFWVSDSRAAFETKAQQLFDQKGQRLIHVTTFREGSARRWVGIARSGDWASNFFVANDREAFDTQSQKLFDQQGRRLTHIHTYLENGQRRWVGIARSGDWANTAFIHRDIDSFRRNAQRLFTDQGRRLVCVEILDDES